MERRRMNNLRLREEVRTNACIVGRIVKSRMKWAAYMARMKGERMPKRSETNKQGGCRKEEDHS